MCTLTVSQAQHCTVNNVQAGGGQHTKIKILFTSDKKSCPNRVQHLWDTYRNEKKTSLEKDLMQFSTSSHGFRIEAPRGPRR